MLVRAKVSAGEKRERIQKIAEGRYEIWVREPAEENRANLRVRELLARELGVVAARVRLTSGHHRPVKTFSISATSSGNAS